MYDIDTNGNDPTFQALSTFEESEGNDDFMSKLQGAYSSCDCFYDNKNF